MKNQESPSIFDLSEEGHAAYSLPSSSAAFEAYEPPAALIRKSPLPLPEVTELNLTHLAYFADGARALGQYY